MTLQDLHQIKDFGGLFGDARFKACLQYLREHPNPKRNSAVSDATLIIRSEGAWHGWFEALSELENLAKPPVEFQPTQPGRPYQRPQQPE